MIKEKLDRMFWKYAEEKFVYGELIPITQSWYLRLPTILKICPKKK